MSLKEVSELLKDLIESQKQLTLRLKMIEIEIISIKENLPGRITNIIEKTEKFDKKVSQKYINELLAKKFASKNAYQKGSMDEILIQKFIKRDPESSLDLWSQNMLLYFLLGNENYTDEGKYIIMINTFIGKINDWFSGLTDDAEKIIKNDTLEGSKNSLQEGITNLKQYIANEFFGGQENTKENK